MGLAHGLQINSSRTNSLGPEVSLAQFLKHRAAWCRIVVGDLPLSWRVRLAASHLGDGPGKWVWTRDCRHKCFCPHQFPSIVPNALYLVVYSNLGSG